MIDLYHNEPGPANGYVHVPNLINFLEANDIPICVMIGARGIGKTYGILEYMLDNDIQHIYMRRVYEHAALCANPLFSDYMKISETKEYETSIYKMKGLKIFGVKKDEEFIGAIAALHQFATARGFNGANFKYCFLDEFIPLEIENSRPGTGKAVLDIYETINRNRELEGKSNFKFLLASNSDNLNSDILYQLGLISKFAKMNEKGKMIEVYDNKLLINFKNSPISKKKAELQKIYKTGQTDYYDMAINNNFKKLSRYNVKRQPIKEYIPIAKVGELCLYLHKTRPEYYCSLVSAGVFPKEYGNQKLEKQKFLAQNRQIFIAFLENRIIFSDETSAHLLQSMYK